MVTIPTAFAQRRISVSGEAGRIWIEALPRRIESLCNQWQLSIDGKPRTGELGIVLPVSRGDVLLALKVSWPDFDSKDEALALRTWDGNGAVRLIDADGDAMLLERANSSLHLSSVSVEDGVGVAGSLLRRLAVPAPEGVPGIADVIERLSRSLLDDSVRLGWPVPHGIVSKSLEYLGLFQITHANLLVNADLHYDNILASQREPWLAIDPKVISGDVEYGIAPLYWNLFRRISVADAQRHFSTLVAVSECDPELARRWTFVRLTDYWLWAVSTGLTEDPKMCSDLLNQLD